MCTCQRKQRQDSVKVLRTRPTPPKYRNRRINMNTRGLFGGRKRACERQREKKVLGGEYKKDTMTYMDENVIMRSIIPQAIFFFKVCACCGVCVEVTGELSGASSLFPPCGSQGLNVGHQDCRRHLYSLRQLTARLIRGMRQGLSVYSM